MEGVAQISLFCRTFWIGWYILDTWSQGSLQGPIHWIPSSCCICPLGNSSGRKSICKGLGWLWLPCNVKYIVYCIRAVFQITAMVAIGDRGDKHLPAEFETNWISYVISSVCKSGSLYPVSVGFSNFLSLLSWTTTASYCPLPSHVMDSLYLCIIRDHFPRDFSKISGQKL